MCGIVGGVAQRDVYPILLEGLKRLEYRGYDSSGMAVLGRDGGIQRHRRVGKVAELEAALAERPLPGGLGIAHTRWATHGAPEERNAHPHLCNDLIAVVHNGIIENFEELRAQQAERGFQFTSDTDTEVVAHQIAWYYQQNGDLLGAVRKAIGDLQGAYALGVIAADDPHTLVAAREGSPLVIGLGIGEHFIASDIQALLPVTHRFIYLENGDVARLTRHRVEVFDRSGAAVDRAEKTTALTDTATSRGRFKHYMLKEIYEQPSAISATLQGRMTHNEVLDSAFGEQAAAVFDRVRNVQIVACGTSYHAGLCARYWLEGLAGIPCAVEVASEYRYRNPVLPEDTLFVTISQSGETADTLAALQQARRKGFLASLAVCNVPESSLVRESELQLMTRAGPEIGVASTKAFTTQLVGLLMLVLALGRRHGLSGEMQQQLLRELNQLPALVERALDKDGEIEALCNEFLDKHHALFLGRGVEYPIAMEGALKLKEISYIHAEAYPAGELKHGPLALVDEDMPVVAIAPGNELLEKLRSNLEEVRARGGRLYVFADERAGFAGDEDSTRVVAIESAPPLVAPVVNVVYLQLLAYHTAVLKGTDVDQPRNLAKSVTVE